jgi:hypothetical protein
VAIGGGVGMTRTVTATITEPTGELGYHPPQAVEYNLGRQQVKTGSTWGTAPMYLHLASATASAVVRGMWLF